MFVFFLEKKSLISGAAVLLIVFVCVYTAAFASEHVWQRRKPVYKGNSAKRQVSIIVNVDWGEEHIPAMLDIFQDNRVQATFFISGRWAEEHPEIAQKIARLGHEIGNHGFSHPHVNALDLDENVEEIEKTSDVLYRAAGEKTRYYAPPYGEFNDTVLDAAYKTGHQLILWTVDTVDWQKPPPAEILSRVLEGIQNGGIILMHPTEQTNQALPEMIQGLKERGYQAVSLEKLIAG